MMGEISGFRMARMIRENTKFSKIPIIFLTAKDTESDRLTGLTFGADAYITKPFLINEVIHRVKFELFFCKYLLKNYESISNFSC